MASGICRARSTFVTSGVKMRYSIEAPCGAGEDVCTLLIGQIPQGGENQLAQRAKITGQTLDREVAPNHAPLRAEELEELTRHSAHGPFVARTAGAS